MVCPAMTEIQGENCEKIMHSVAGLCLEAYVKIKPFEPVYGDTFDKSIYIFITKSLLTCDWVNMHISMYYQPTCGVSNVRHCIMEREYIVLYITTNDVDCLGALTSLDKRDMLLNETGFSINATIHVYDVMSEILEKTDAKEATYIGDFLMPVRGTEALHPCRFTSKPLTVSKFLVCPAVRLKIKDMSMFLRNGSIHIPEIGLTLSKRDFVVDRNGILVCIDDYIPSTRAVVIDDTKQEHHATDGEQTNIIGFTTLICVCSSIVSLIITLAIYIFLPQLRTQPGINNMFLSVSLLLALIMFQFGAGRTENPTTCTAIGVTIHFLWLNNIFWMNICCYHMFRVFSSIRLTSLNNACTRTTLKYCLYCISLSSVSVVTNVMYSLSNENNGTIGYGKRAKMCYIKSPIMVAFTMTLPTSMIVLINFAMYTKVICSISRNRFEAILSRKHNRNFTMYVKLSTLTGLAWLSYIPVYFTAHIAFEIIFSALVTCQGVFIMIAFVCNKRVFRAFKNKLTGREPGNSSSKYTSSSKDTTVSTITRS